MNEVNRQNIYTYAQKYIGGMDCVAVLPWDRSYIHLCWLNTAEQRIIPPVQDNGACPVIHSNWSHHLVTRQHIYSQQCMVHGLIHSSKLNGRLIQEMCSVEEIKLVF